MFQVQKTTADTKAFRWERAQYAADIGDRVFQRGIDGAQEKAKHGQLHRP